MVRLDGICRALLAFSKDIHQVSRNPHKVNTSYETMVADLLDGQATANAVAGSEVVYLVAGLTYNLAIWQDQWQYTVGWQ